MKLTMQPAISLDGYIAKLDGDSYTWVNPADEARYQEVVKKCGAILTGRKTYEEYKEDFEAYDNVMIFVCTTDTKLEDSGSVKYVRGTAEEIVKQIENTATFDEMVVSGGGEINGLLAAAGLVDEIVVSIQPVVLGEGIPLFGTYKPNLQLELLSTNQDIKGVTQNHYRVVK